MKFPCQKLARERNNILETPSALAAWSLTFNLDRAPSNILRTAAPRGGRKRRCTLGRKLRLHAAKADGVSSMLLPLEQNFPFHLLSFDR